jgi:hypothetical protein
MTLAVSPDGLAVQFNLAGFSLAIGGREDAPLAGATGLAGALPVDVPRDYFLAGFHLVVDDGFLLMTPHSEALFTCSIGHSSTAVELPKGYALAPIPTNPPASGERPRFEPGDGASFPAECFTGDANTAIVGIPLPPLPITLSMQARCWGPDELVNMEVTSFTISLLLGAIPPAPGGQDGGARNGR